MEKKYRLTDETMMLPDGTRLHRIMALRDFGDVQAGDLGGFVEKEANLSHKGGARVYGGAEVCDDARVYGGDDLYTFGYFGSANRATTAFKTKDGGIVVACGCFCGTLAEFRSKVRETHGTNDYAAEYLMIADLIEHKLAGRKKA